MEGKYIFAIVVLGIFFLLIFVSFAFLEYGRIKEDKLQAWINERNANNELNNPDYDTVTEEEEISAQTMQESGVDEKVINEDTADDEKVPEESYGKIDIEGIEEITGNYNGDDK